MSFLTTTEKWLRWLLLSLAMLMLFAFTINGVLAYLVLPRFEGYDIALPNQYVLSKVEGWAFVISNANSKRVVDLSIQRYAVNGDMVTGFVSHRGLENHPHELGKEGYFILDTATGALREGLTEQMWRDALVAQGFPTPPLLKEPSREDGMPH